MENDDNISSGEGGDPPELEPLRRRRSAKLKGNIRDCVGDLAFLLYSIGKLDVPDAHKWRLLCAKLLAWRGRWI